MSGRDEDTDAYDERWGADPEDPQACDLDNEDDEDETPTTPCPACGREIPDFVDRCPYCGDWVVQGSGGGGRKGWVVVAAILALAAFIAWIVW